MRKTAVGILLAVVFVVLTVGVASALPALPDKLPGAAKIASPAIDDETGELKAPPEFVAELPEGELTKIVFIRYAPEKEPLATCGNEICEPKENWKNCPSDCPKGGEEPTTACYGFLTGSKPKWNWIEDYVYNDESLVSPSSSSVATWGASVSGDIFGVGGYATGYDWGVYDYKNSLNYGDYNDTGLCPTPEPCVIAVTASWFRGKNIYEYDIMFDTDYTWGDATVDPTVIDLRTVTLHEFGHGAGLDDLYDVVCEENVMYGIYTGVKTSLGGGDITGIQKLYGE